MVSETDILQGKLKLDQKSLAISNAQDKMIKDLNKYVVNNPNLILDNPSFRQMASLRFEDGKFIVDNTPENIDARLNRYIKNGFFSTDHKVSKRTGKLNIEFPTNKQIVPTFINGPIRSMENYIINNIKNYNTDDVVRANIDNIVDVAKNNNFTVNVPKGYANIFGTNRTNVGAIADVATVSADGSVLKSYDDQLKRFNVNVDNIPELVNTKLVDYTPIDKSKISQTLETKFKTLSSLQKPQNNPLLKSQKGFVTPELLFAPYKGASKVIRTLTKYVGAPDALFGYLDYQNELSKGKTEEEALNQALTNSSLGLYKNKEYMNQLKNVAESMGVDTKGFDSAYRINLLEQDYEKNNARFEKNMEVLYQTGRTKEADALRKNFNNYIKDLNNQYNVLTKDLSQRVVGGSPQIMSRAEDIITEKQFQKPFVDMQNVALEKLKREKIKASPIQKRQVDTTAGKIGEDFYQAFDSLTQGAKNVLQGRIIPFASKIGLPQYEPQPSQREILSDTLQNLSDRDLERFNLGRGYVQSQPVTDQDILNLQYSQPGVFYSEGGVASGPPPKKGPDPQGQGLLSLIKNAKNY